MGIIKLLIADPPPGIRDLLRGTLQEKKEVEIVAEAPDGDSVLREVAQRNPDVVLMEASSPRLGASGLIRVIKAQWPSTRVVLTTAVGVPSLVRVAIVAGADGCIPQEASRELLMSALKAVQQGLFVMDGKLWRQLLSSLSERG